MLQSPADKGGDMGHEGLTAGGEAVLNSRRHFGINLPADKPYLFNPFERYDQLVYFVLPIAEMDIPFTEDINRIISQLNIST